MGHSFPKKKHSWTATRQCSETTGCGLLYLSFQFPFRIYFLQESNSIFVKKQKYKKGIVGLTYGHDNDPSKFYFKVLRWP